MPDITADSSILSHGEREVAAMLDDGHSADEIATARDESVESIEKAIDRIREKTDRALATLLASPFTDRAAADLDPAARKRLRSELDTCQ
jgi:DNA-binding NarL/FixJ family response regulator